MSRQSTGQSIIAARGLVKPLAAATSKVNRAEVLKQYTIKCARHHSACAGDPIAGVVSRAWQRQFN
jgi:hypothetical protein